MLLQEVTTHKFTNIDEIHKWLATCKITQYTVDPVTLVVDVNQPVNISWRQLISEKIPVQFGTINGDFTILPDASIRTLEGCPRIINGQFSCQSNKTLNTLIGGPEIIRGDAAYHNCSFWELNGIAKEVHGNIHLSKTGLKTISGIHKHIKLIDGELLLGATGAMLKGGVLGLMLIRKLKKVVIMEKLISGPNNIDKVFQIINKHLATGRSGPDCQLELQDAGFSQYAKL